MSNKDQKISSILAIASGKLHKIIRARPEMFFTLVDRSNNLFENDQTGEEFTWRQIQERYIIDPNRFWGFASMADCPEGDDLYFTKVNLLSVCKDEVIFIDKEIIYEDDIAIKFEEHAQI